MNMDDMNEDQQDRFNEIKRKTSHSQDQLLGLLDKAMSKVGTDDVGEGLARLEGLLRGDMRGGGQEFLGVVLGQQDVRDLNQSVRQTLETLEEIKQTGEAQMVENLGKEVGPDQPVEIGGNQFVVSEQTYRDPQGRLLDLRKQFQTGNDNPNYGNPLGENIVRDVYGVAVPTDEDGAPDGDQRFFEVQLSDDKARQGVEWDMVGEPMRFYADLNEERQGTYYLYSTPSTQFTEDNLTDDIELDVENTIAEAAANRVTEINDIDEKSEDLGPFEPFIIEGTVTSVNTSGSTHIFNVTDFSCEAPARVIMNNGQQAKFGPNSEVIVIGSGNWQEADPDSDFDEPYDEQAVVFADGVIVTEKSTGDAGADAVIDSESSEESSEDEVVAEIEEDDWE